VKKEEWMNEKVFVDIYGREQNLSDAPMTFMTRKQALLKRGYTDELIDKMWGLGND
tara:strand:+ start:1730 stop:1897 length:168 start_codon:yes stop_codon:yes gene_type:complete